MKIENIVNTLSLPFLQCFDFLKPVYQNPYLPQALIEKWENESWQAWYNPKNPEIQRHI